MLISSVNFVVWSSEYGSFKLAEGRESLRECENW
jgi:hypothetical protein